MKSLKKTYFNLKLKVVRRLVDYLWKTNRKRGKRTKISVFRGQLFLKLNHQVNILKDKLK